MTWDHLGSTLCTPPLPPLGKSMYSYSVFLLLCPLLTFSKESGQSSPKHCRLLRVKIRVPACTDQLIVSKIIQEGQDNLSIHRGAALDDIIQQVSERWSHRIPLVKGFMQDSILLIPSGYSENLWGVVPYSSCRVDGWLQLHSYRITSSSSRTFKVQHKRIKSSKMVKITDVKCSHISSVLEKWHFWKSLQWVSIHANSTLINFSPKWRKLLF